MTKVAIEVVEDVCHPEGGHAIIRLSSVTVWPVKDVFLIEPADGSVPTKDLKGWPWGARTPLTSRLTIHGFEIVAGPDVVESPMLMPGTPVNIKVPGAGVQCNVIWPDIKRLQDKRAQQNVASLDRVQAKSGKKTDLLLESPADLLRNLASLELGDRSTGTRDSTRNDTGAFFELGSPGMMADEISKMDMTMPTALGSARNKGPGSNTVDDGSDLPASKTGFAIAAPAVRRARVTHENRQVVATQRQHDRHQLTTRRYAIAALVVALLASGISAISQFGKLNSWFERGVSDITATPAQQNASPQVSLYDALKVDHAGPSGEDARNLDAEEVIRRADQSLDGNPGRRNTKARAFWLKQYIAKQFGDKQSLWALTQLGSIFAQPVGATPDYAKARVLWELSSALGDPVAACFLGRLHEFGLGVKANKPEAQKWYRRAKMTGGCQSIDRSSMRIVE